MAEKVESPVVAVEAPTSPVPPVPVLVLHQFPRSSVAPNLSPFALKLETYLRLAKIKYENDFSMKAGSKGKSPWISYNNQDVADSSFIIDFLKNVPAIAGIDLNAHLSASEKAISRAFQKLVEEELVWSLALWRWTYDKDESILHHIGSGKIKNFVMMKVIRNRTKSAAHGHGIGRHSQEEVMKIGHDDIQALSEFLGSKKHFMGEQVSEVDCAIFGLLAQLLYTSPTCPLTTFIKEKHGNLVEYCDRLKAEVWPDWEEICQAVVVEKESKKKVSKTASPTTETLETTNVVAGSGVAENGVAHEATNGNHHETVKEEIANGEVTITTHSETTKTVLLENGQPAVVHIVEDTIKHVPLSNGDGMKENGHHHVEAVAPAV